MIDIIDKLLIETKDIDEIIKLTADKMNKIQLKVKNINTNNFDKFYQVKLSEVFSVKPFNEEISEIKTQKLETIEREIELVTRNILEKQKNIDIIECKIKIYLDKDIYNIIHSREISDINFFVFDNIQDIDKIDLTLISTYCDFYNIYSLVIDNKTKGLEILNEYVSTDIDETFYIDKLKGFLEGKIDLSLLYNIRNLLIIFPDVLRIKYNLEKICSIFNLSRKEIFLLIIDIKHIDEYIDDMSINFDIFVGQGIYNTTKKKLDISNKLLEMSNSLTVLFHQFSSFIKLYNRVHNLKEIVRQKLYIENLYYFITNYACLYIANYFEIFLKLTFIKNNNFINIEYVTEKLIGILMEPNLLINEDIKERILMDLEAITLINLNKNYDTSTTYINLRDSNCKVIYILIFLYIINQKK
jgi:hypothetical protein